MAISRIIISPTVSCFYIESHLALDSNMIQTLMTTCLYCSMLCLQPLLGRDILSDNKMSNLHPGGCLQILAQKVLQICNTIKAVIIS